MMNNAIIRIKGTQGLNSAPDVIELTTEGRFGLKDGAVLISYDESELSGMPGVHTVIRLNPPGKAVLKRTGNLISELKIELGKTIECRYGTVCGDIMLSITGEEMKINFNEAGGNLQMAYRIDSGQHIISRNQVEINVREVK